MKCILKPQKKKEYRLNLKHKLEWPSGKSIAQIRTKSIKNKTKYMMLQEFYHFSRTCLWRYFISNEFPYRCWITVVFTNSCFCSFTVGFINIKLLCVIYYFALLGLCFLFCFRQNAGFVVSLCTIVCNSDFPDECMMND